MLASRQFEHVFAAASKSSDRCLLVLGRPNGTGDARLGLAIARKHLRASPARNRVKRIVRERFRKIRRTLGGIDFVVLAREGARDASNAELDSSVSKHLYAVARRAHGR